MFDSITDALANGVDIRHKIEPKAAIYLGGGMFVAIVLGFLVGTLILKKL